MAFSREMVAFFKALERNNDRAWFGARKELFERRVREPIQAELDAAWAAVVSQWGHPDAMEGPTAFVERRAPHWAEPAALAVS